MTTTGVGLTRRELLQTIGFGAAAICVESVGKAAPAPDHPREGAVSSEQELVQIIDLHVDLPYQVAYKGRSLNQGSGQFPASSLGGAGIKGVVLPLYVPRHQRIPTANPNQLEVLYQRILGVLVGSSDFAMPGESPKPGQVATWWSVEGAAPWLTCQEDVDLWAGRGVRLFGLVHAEDNLLACSATGHHSTDQGLSHRGEALVRRIFALGAAVDVSHASDRTVEDVVACAGSAGGIVVASHSNARAICDHPRNLPKRLIEMIAGTGGLVGCNLHSRYLSRTPRPGISDVVEHIAYMVHLVGEEHVGLGTDYEGGILPAVGLESAASLQRLVPAMIEAGLSREAVGKVLGGNAKQLLADRTFPGHANGDMKGRVDEEQPR